MGRRNLLSILSLSLHRVIGVHRIPVFLHTWTRRRRKRHLGRITFTQLSLSLLLHDVLQRRIEFFVVSRLFGCLYLGLRRQLDKFCVKGR